eukprot:637568-Pelagomonas_calceolata.AAC.3
MQYTISHVVKESKKTSDHHVCSPQPPAFDALCSLLCIFTKFDAPMFSLRSTAFGSPQPPAFGDLCSLDILIELGAPMFSLLTVAITHLSLQPGELCGLLDILIDLPGSACKDRHSTLYQILPSCTQSFLSPAFRSVSKAWTHCGRAIARTDTVPFTRSFLLALSQFYLLHPTALTEQPIGQALKPTPDQLQENWQDPWQDSLARPPGMQTIAAEHELGNAVFIKQCSPVPFWSGKLIARANNMKECARQSIWHFSPNCATMP